jgi:hypothetical protein
VNSRALGILNQPVKEGLHNLTKASASRNVDARHGTLNEVGGNHIYNTNHIARVLQSTVASVSETVSDHHETLNEIGGNQISNVPLRRVP